MLTESQKEQFADALASIGGGLIDAEEDVVATRDTVSDFAGQYDRQIGGKAEVDGLVIHVFLQKKRHKNIYVADFGDARACYAM